jgi:hypothetical protein
MNGISNAWLAAAADLGLSVAAPASLDSPGGLETFDALIKDFGSPEGVLVVAIGSVTSDMRRLAESRGMFLSELSADAYGSYSRELFVDALRDWGWFGPTSSRPTWLSDA